jgi:hypothetical protein
LNAPETTPQALVGPSSLRLDLPRGRAQPAAWRWIIATVVAVGGSLLACFALATAAMALFPALVGYEHFQFGDYSKLTIIGVVGAAVGWPIATWFTTSARRFYLWLAIAVTVVTLAPDAWILHLGQPPIGVATLVIMHLALALITYPAMVFIAPQRTIRTRESSLNG